MGDATPSQETPAERRRLNRYLARLHKEQRAAARPVASQKLTNAQKHQRRRETWERERSVASRLAARWFGTPADRPVGTHPTTYPTSSTNPRTGLPPLIVYHYEYWQLLVMGVDLLDEWYHRDAFGKPVALEQCAAWVWWTTKATHADRAKLIPPTAVRWAAPSPQTLEQFGPGGARTRARWN